MLAQPDTKVIQRRLKICGESNWEWDTETKKVTNIRIYLDPRRDGRVSLVLHELLHIWWGVHMEMHNRLVYELEESAVRAWEKTLYLWLHDSKRAAALESWNQAIQRKMS